MNILVISAHPDDEVLGMGATIKKLSRTNKIWLCVVSEGTSSQYSDKKMIRVRSDACKKSAKILGISKIQFLDYPDMRLDSVPHLEINKQLEKIIKKFKPSIVYSPPSHDLNKDHQKVFESSLVVTRPLVSSVKSLLCYELPGPVREPFRPTIYENVEKEFSYKIKGFKMYKSEIMKFPHLRSINAIENLAIYRGTQSGLRKAEAFELVHSIE